MRTIFKYRDKYWRDYVLLFRVGSMPTATQILENCNDPTPENKTLQHQLARIGCRLHRVGEYVDKRQHEKDTLEVA